MVHRFQPSVWYGVSNLLKSRRKFKFGKWTGPIQSVAQKVVFQNQEVGDQGDQPPKTMTRTRHNWSLDLVIMLRHEASEQKLTELNGQRSIV